jgi:hypothetical protein
MKGHLTRVKITKVYHPEQQDDEEGNKKAGFHSVPILAA